MSRLRAPVAIQNCQFWLKLLCPKTWTQLERTSLLDVRHCPVCRKDVYYCESVEDAIEQRQAGNSFCVAHPENPEGIG